MYNDRTEPAITALLNDETPSSIHKLLVQVASIYDVKDLAAQLNAATGSDWSRASLIRQIKGSVNECRITRKNIIIFDRCSPHAQQTMTRNFSVLLTCLLGSVASGVVLTPLAGNACLQANGISSPAGHTVQTGTVTRLSTISTQISGTLHSVIFPMFRMTGPMLLSMHPSQTMMFCSQVSHANRSVLPVSAKELFGPKTRL